jgi:hypothetical protein
LIVWGGETKSDRRVKPEKEDDGLYLLNLGAFVLLFAGVLC